MSTTLHRLVCHLTRYICISDVVYVKVHAAGVSGDCAREEAIL